ncbi:uncharacterized protein LODBEIA_P60060 [Lodderomyces beijingensis]|uniref:Transmembrane protein n=1 Tax=Lodderomyces beijingensis TaxID=1775926 RepID=A0ABP0ZVU4_9ASCO
MPPFDVQGYAREQFEEEAGEKAEEPTFVKLELRGDESTERELERNEEPRMRRRNKKRKSNEDTNESKQPKMWTQYFIAGGTGGAGQNRVPWYGQPIHLMAIFDKHFQSGNHPRNGETREADVVDRNPFGFRTSNSFNHGHTSNSNNNSLHNELLESDSDSEPSNCNDFRGIFMFASIPLAILVLVCLYALLRQFCSGVAPTVRKICRFQNNGNVPPRKKLQSDEIVDVDVDVDVDVAAQAEAEASPPAYSEKSPVWLEPPPPTFAPPRASHVENEASSANFFSQREV